MGEEIPAWLKIKNYDGASYLETKNAIENNNLNTVCIEANCPNRYECFSKGTATFMILGDTCTRNCRYCNIKKGVPEEIDENEPQRIADAISKLDLDYAVITCVTRDDLLDCGAEHFARTVSAIRRLKPGCRIELLISDLGGDIDALKTIMDSGPDVLNHNIEVARDLFKEMRPKGDYSLSLEILKAAKRINPKIKTKSGFMIGLGESDEQIMSTIKDLKKAGCDIITIGQYLRPSKNHAEVKKYYTPKEFEKIEKAAKSLGIRNIVCGPLVRSSYRAGECFNGK